MSSHASIAFMAAVLFVYGPSALVQTCGAEDRVPAPPQRGPSDTADLRPEGLSAPDWSDIRAVYEANRHAAFAVDGGYQARNPGQQWRTRFDGRGFLTTPDAGVHHGGSSSWSWGLELVSYGREGAERAIETVAPAISRCGQRVEYEWDENLTEWYVNDGRGLEHGYTIQRRPLLGKCPNGAMTSSPGFPLKADTLGRRVDHIHNPVRVVAQPPLGLFLSARTFPRVAAARQPWAEGHYAVGVATEPLRFTLAVRGDLCPQVSGDGRDVTFVNSSGAAVVHYRGLTVQDADGAAVPAWFGVNSGQWSVDSDQQILSIVVDDGGARYPLTIDPIAQQAYLKASNTNASDFFGISVAVSGDTVVVGATSESSSATGVDGDQADNSAGDSGAAYVFVRSGATWSQEAYLKASNTGAGDQFGGSVAVSGDTVVVGADFEDSSATGVDGDQADNSAESSGAAYVFVRSGTTWSQQAYLKASNTGVGDVFGSSVAVSGDTVVVGASDEDSNATGVDGNQAANSASAAGAAYVFVRSGGVWSQQAYLKASNTGANDQFGGLSSSTLTTSGVAVSGDTVVVGARGEGSSATGVDGNQADNSAVGSGAAYVFIRIGETWSQQAYLKASNTETNDQFGYSVAASGGTVTVGAFNEDSNATGINGNEADNSAVGSGAAYVFVRSGTTWSQQAYLKASNTDAGDSFGRSLAVSGDTVVVGASQEDSSATGVDGNQADNSAANTGAAYVFIRIGETWSQQAYLKASNTGGSDQFGNSVALSGATVVVGGWLEDSNATGVDGNQADNSAGNSGAAYVFALPDADGDSVPDMTDNCPNDANPNQADLDDDGIGDVCDADIDGDDVPNTVDICPNNASGLAVDSAGRPLSDLNDDCNVNGLDIQPYVFDLVVRLV